MGLALFVRLGIWQLDRAQQKTDALSAFASGAKAPPRAFLSLPTELAQGDYPHVVLSGHFDLNHTYLLDNQMHNGMPGLNVIGVFLIANDARGLLVNLGWISRLRDRQAPLALPSLPSGTVELTGLYAPLPGIGVRLGSNPLPQQNQWPKLVTYLDLDDIQVDLARKLFARLLLLDPEVNTEFVRDWQPHTMPPEKHRAYAAQWFSLALAVLVIFILMHYRKREET